MSKNGVDVFVTSTATNAFCNIGLKGNNPWYNAVSRDGVSSTAVRSVEPKTTDGLIRVIDNRTNGGKLLCVTAKGIYPIE